MELKLSIEHFYEFGRTSLYSTIMELKQLPTSQLLKTWRPLYSTIMELKLFGTWIIIKACKSLYSTIMELKRCWPSKTKGWYSLFIAPLWNWNITLDFPLINLLCSLYSTIMELKLSTLEYWVPKSKPLYSTIMELKLLY